MVNSKETQINNEICIADPKTTIVMHMLVWYRPVPKYTGDHSHKLNYSYAYMFFCPLPSDYKVLDRYTIGFYRPKCTDYFLLKHTVNNTKQCYFSYT